ncbi:MAG: putative lipid II flippase FtsW [Myxococcota bacterium]
MKAKRRNADAEAPTAMPTPELPPNDLVRNVDPWMALSVVVLLSVGVVLVYSASAVRTAQAGGNAAEFLMQHLVSVIAGLVALFAVLQCKVDAWGRWAYPLLGVTFILLIAVWVPGLGRNAHGAQRWLTLGPVGFQPAELAKLTVVLYLAHSLAKKRDKASTFSVGFVPHVLVTGVLVALILIQPDIGTSAIVFAVLGLMLFVAGTRIGYLMLAFVAALPIAAWYVVSHPHAADRLLAFLAPEQHKQTIGYQVWESLVAFGSGGALGLGLGDGSQKLFIPAAHTDFIFAVIGQELGFVGVLVVVVGFIGFVGRGLWLSSQLPSRFAMFMIFGLCAWLGLQAAVNMAVVMSLLPTKGLTLPLVSFGRSSLIISMIAVGIVMRASAELRVQRSRGMGS